MTLPPFIHALRLPAAYPHPVDTVRLIETHISWVLIAGAFAYKIKKPVDFGFLDFSTLKKRHFCCEEELRLNRRLAPDIYLRVVTINGTQESARVAGDGPVLEYAVQMRAFPADSTLDRESVVAPEQIDAIADRIACFHGEIERSPPDSDYGLPESVMAPVRDNFRHIRALGLDDAELARLGGLERWSESEGQRLGAHFLTRKHDGYIRECHGDLHLGNIAWADGAPIIFDCIEFNPRLRFIDVVSETAFMFMDLIERGHEPMAWRFLNRYLAATGDYAGLPAFRYYLAYRALVRAKVALLRAAQDDPSARAEGRRYIGLAARLSSPGAARLFLMHGVSGSGKSRLAADLAESLGAIWLRSDVERKRLFGLGPLDDSRAIPGGIYTPDASRLTFEHLLDLARGLLAEGHAVIVDATFLRRQHRQPFQNLAEEMRVDWNILSLRADPDILRQRVAERAARADDASEATLDVLNAQLASQEALSPEEESHCLCFDLAQRDTWPGLFHPLAALAVD